MTPDDETADPCIICGWDPCACDEIYDRYRDAEFYD